MKRLTDTKVVRGQALNEWRSAESHLTVDGLNDFAARQRERQAQANRERQESRSHVAIFAGRRKEKK